MNLGLFELGCLCGFASVFLGVVGFIVYRIVAFDVRHVGLAANIERRALTFRAAWSGHVKSDVSLVRTTRRSAPIAVALVQRDLMGVGGIGASLTREQALALAGWLREAASATRRD